MYGRFPDEDGNVDLSLELARRRLARYRSADDDLMVRHREAMECHALEEWVETGLDAYRAMCNAETVVRQAVVEGIEVGDDLPETLRFFYEQWLEMEGNVLSMIDAQKQRGFTVVREIEFHNACADVRDRLSVIQLHDVLDSIADGRVFISYSSVPPAVR
jgi:hypothetical protein